MSSTDGANISQKLVRAIKLDSGGLSKTLERLSAGVNISENLNNSADVILTSKLSTDSRLYSKAVANINDAISVTSIASEALSALSTILDQQQELAGMAQNPDLSDAKRALIQEESNQLTDNFNKIIESTKVNTIELLNRPQTSVSVQAGISGNTGQIQFNIGLGDSIAASALDYEYSSPFAESFNNQQLADLNGDGNLDVLGISGNDAIVYLGDGTGEFQRTQAFTAETQVSGKVELADFNGDGNYDLVPISYIYGSTTHLSDGPESAVVYFGNSDGTFGAGATINADFIASTTGDFNGDGRDDIAGQVWRAGFNRWEDSVVYGNSDGSFTTPDFRGIAYNRFSSTSEDLNEDGSDDLATLHYFPLDPYIHLDYVGGVSINGPLSPLSLANQLASGRELNLLVEDFNNDGNSDLSITLDGSNQLYLGNGNLTFQSAISMAISETTGDTEAGDINNDGNIDIVRGQSVLFGNGDGTFSMSTSITGGNVNFELGDVNNDGALDIISDVLRLSHINTLNNTRMSYLNLTDTTAATSASTFTENVKGLIDLQSASTSAAQSRLSQASTFADIMRENNAAASDKVSSIDHAQELATLVATKIRLYSSTALLAQVENLYISVTDLLK